MKYRSVCLALGLCALSAATAGDRSARSSAPAELRQLELREGAQAAYDYARDKARANFESARERCSWGADEREADRCERAARSEYQARLDAARSGYRANLRGADASASD